VIGNTLGTERVEVADNDDEVDPASRLVEVSLAALEPDESPAGPDDRRQLEITVRGAALDDAEFRLRLDEAADLVQRGLDPILDTLERDADGELRLQAGLVSQSSFAIETLLRGMTAQLAGDVRRAATLFEAALAEDPGFEFARYELAIALRRDGETERAIAILEPMAERLSGDFWQMRIQNALGVGYWRLRRYDEALDALRRADAASHSPADRATALGNIGLLERNLGQLDQAEATLREAIRLADLAEIGRHQAASRNTLASVLVGLDRDREALGYLDAAREQFYEIGDLRGYAAVLSRTARIRTALGERNEPEALLRLALGVREQIDDRAGSIDIRIRLADLERIRGNFEEARTLATVALEESRALEEDDLTIDGYRALAELALADRRFEQATLYGREALRLAELTGREGDQRAVRHGLLAVELASEVATDRGTADDRGARIRQLIDDADTADDTVIRVRARILSARHFRAIRQFDDARRALDRAGEVLVAADVRLRREIDAERARLGLERGDLDDAAAAVERLERSDSAPHPILMLKARLQAERGDLIGAVETAALAEATVGNWWTAEDQALLDRWSEANRR
jgi:tetratricopeptide (TPR) repeat protein